MSPPFRVTLVAMALIAALGSLPASARGGGGGFHGGGFQVASIAVSSALASTVASSCALGRGCLLRKSPRR
jgi:hypothetical protein